MPALLKRKSRIEDLLRCLRWAVIVLRRHTAPKVPRKQLKLALNWFYVAQFQSESVVTAIGEDNLEIEKALKKGQNALFAAWLNR